MGTLKIKVLVNVDKAEALKRGLVGNGPAVVEIDPMTLTPEQRGLLIECDKESYGGGARRHAEQRGLFYDFALVSRVTRECRIDVMVYAATEACVIEALTEVFEAKAKEAEADGLAQIEHEARVRALLEQARSLPLRAVFVGTNEERCWRYSEPIVTPIPCMVAPCNVDALHVPFGLNDEVTKRLRQEQWYADIVSTTEARAEEARKEHTAKVAAAEAAHAQKKADKEAAEAAKAAELDRLVCAWVEKHGTDSQRERLAANVLNNDEIVDIMREEAFEAINRYSSSAMLSSLPRYEKMAQCEVEHGEECCDAQYHTSIETLQSLTDEEWTRVKALRATVGDRGTVVPRLHEMWCSCEGGSVLRRKGLLVTLKGPFGFSREFELSS